MRPNRHNRLLAFKRSLFQNLILVCSKTQLIACQNVVKCSLPSWRYQNTNLYTSYLFLESVINLNGIDGCHFINLLCSNGQQQQPSPLRNDHMIGTMLTALHIIAQVSKQLFYAVSLTPLCPLHIWKKLRLRNIPQFSQDHPNTE